MDERPSKGSPKTLVQCDFDGTITQRDVSSELLARHARGNWKSHFKDYKEGRITVEQFSARAFALVVESRSILLRTARKTSALRPGFKRFVADCQRSEVEFVIVSNGLDFYIQALLEDWGLQSIEFHSACAVFNPNGLRIRYYDPEGHTLKGDLKEAYIMKFLARGDRVVYIGNGTSDIKAALHAHRVWATGDLLEHFRSRRIACCPYENFYDIAGAERLID